MTAIVWDDVGERFYETGVDRGVLYPIDATGAYPLGVGWNGLTGVTESPSGGETTPFYADNSKYLELQSVEEFGATIEAFTYPSQFEVCDGSVEPLPGLSFGQQSRTKFGLAYRSILGNDVDGNELGYKLHLVYNCLAAPSERSRKTINDAPEAMTFSWAVTTTPITVAGYKPTSHLVIDSTKVNAAKLAALELILYGDVAVDPRLPLPAEVITLLT